MLTSHHDRLSTTQPNRAEDTKDTIMATTKTAQTTDATAKTADATANTETAQTTDATAKTGGEQMVFFQEFGIVELQRAEAKEASPHQTPREIIPEEKMESVLGFLAYIRKQKEMTNVTAFIQPIGLDFDSAWDLRKWLAAGTKILQEEGENFATMVAICRKSSANAKWERKSLNGTLTTIREMNLPSTTFYGVRVRVLDARRKEIGKLTDEAKAMRAATRAANKAMKELQNQASEIADDGKD